MDFVTANFVTINRRQFKSGSAIQNGQTATYYGSLLLELEDGTSRYLNTCGDKQDGVIAIDGNPVQTPYGAGFVLCIKPATDVASTVVANVGTPGEARIFMNEPRGSVHWSATAAEKSA